MIDQVLAGPGVSVVLEDVTGNFTGGVTSGGTHEVQLQRKRRGSSTWGVVRVLRNTDEESEFRGFEAAGGQRNMDYRYEVVSGTNVELWLTA